MPTQYGHFKIYGYVNDITGEHHVALVKGDIGDGEDWTNNTFPSPLSAFLFLEFKNIASFPSSQMSYPLILSDFKT